MTRIYLMLVCALLVSPLCSMTAARLDHAPGATVTASASVEPSPTMTREPQTCAVVKAETAVHLRGGPSATSAILNHLRGGEVVEVEGMDNGGWWRVSSRKGAGYVKAVYLTVQECER